MLFKVTLLYSFIFVSLFTFYIIKIIVVVSFDIQSNCRYYPLMIFAILWDKYGSLQSFPSLKSNFQ